MPNRLILALIYCFSYLLLPAQEYQPTNGSLAAAHFQDAQSALLAREYRLAIRHFEKALQQQEGLVVAQRMIGQCHALLGEYPEAASAYLQVLKQDSLFSRLIYFELGDTYYKMGKPELALSYFKVFQQLQDIPVDQFGLHGVEELAEELLVQDRLNSNIRACQLSIDSVKFINITEIQNLGNNINSKQDDYFPFLTNNQEQLFYTRQLDNGDEDLYFSRFRNGQWRSAERIKNFNTDQPEGMSTLVRNGRQLFFTACLRDSVAGPCDIWEALVDGSEVKSITALGAPINSVYWESQAAVSCDGRQLYFASNRPGGLGGTDIYMTERTASGSWSLPVNLGAPLNTPGDEEAPYISNDGQTLYFSSTGHLGLGEQDIFMSWWDDRKDRWSMPINLGPPVNGPHRELGFYLSADGKTGFFASNRPGGAGGMDIYRFELSEKLYGEPITFLEGIVKDSVLLTGITTSVAINGRAPVETDTEGRFFLCAGADETLDFQVAAAEYRPYHNQFFIPLWDNRQFYTIDLLLKPKLSFLADLEAESNEEELTRRSVPEEQIILHSILYGFDSADLDNNEVKSLEDLLTDLEKVKVLKVEIVGYADDIGAQSYNLQLSEERAKNVAVFLLSRSVAVNDIHIEGKGTVTNDKERAYNRRVDIKITVKE
jgi:flagellar motor protein MotB/tetratricopeptide (TPR) repeat protein